MIYGIQQAVGAALDFQAIVDVVGDTLREVFATGNLSIWWQEEPGGPTRSLYSYEHGVRDPRRCFERAGAGRVPVAMAIGIASGAVVAGWAGAPRDAAYTCVGAAVREAEALAGAAAAAGSEPRLDAATRTALAG